MSDLLNSDDDGDYTDGIYQYFIYYLNEYIQDIGEDDFYESAGDSYPGYELQTLIGRVVTHCSICKPISPPVLRPASATAPQAAGKMRAEGKDYIVKDGCVLNFLLYM